MYERDNNRTKEQKITQSYQLVFHKSSKPAPNKDLTCCSCLMLLIDILGFVSISFDKDLYSKIVTIQILGFDFDFYSLALTLTIVMKIHL